MSKFFDLKTFSDKFRIFLPSDPTNPFDTMLMIEGDIVFLPDGNSSYISILEWNITRINGREKSDPSLVYVRPRFDGSSKDLSRFYFKNNKELTESKQSKISFTVTDLPDIVKMTYATYEFVTAQGIVLGAVQVPLFVPAA